MSGDGNNGDVDTSPKGVPLDTTGDGKIDAYGLDTTGDGKIDSLDTNMDGHIDTRVRSVLRCHECSSGPGLCESCRELFLSGEWRHLRDEWKVKQNSTGGKNSNASSPTRSPSRSPVWSASSSPKSLSSARRIRQLEIENSMLAAQLKERTGGSPVSGATKRGPDSHTARHIYLSDNFLDKPRYGGGCAEVSQRLRGLQFWNELTLAIEDKGFNRQSTFHMAGNLAVRGRLSAVDGKLENFHVTDLQTPQYLYPSSVLRSSDIDMIDVDVDLSPGGSSRSVIQRLLEQAIASRKDKKEVDDGIGESRTKGDRENPYGDSMEKYWDQRYRFFSKFDEGIETDAQGLFSVTPEAIAVYLAKKCKCKIIVDGFCGIGGNAIHFAEVCDKVIAIDIDPRKIECAKKNASVYGVEHKIEFLIGDFYELAPTIQGDIVFLAPPWGGPEYLRTSGGSAHSLLSSPEEKSGKTLVQAGLEVSENVAILLPRNAQEKELQKFSVQSLEYHYLNTKKKTACAYIGPSFSTNLLS